MSLIDSAFLLSFYERDRALMSLLTHLHTHTHKKRDRERERTLYNFYPPFMWGGRERERVTISYSSLLSYFCLLIIPSSPLNMERERGREGDRGGRGETETVASISPCLPIHHPKLERERESDRVGERERLKAGHCPCLLSSSLFNTHRERGRLNTSTPSII